MRVVVRAPGAVIAAALAVVGVPVVRAADVVPGVRAADAVARGALVADAAEIAAAAGAAAVVIGTAPPRVARPIG